MIKKYITCFIFITVVLLFTGCDKKDEAVPHPETETKVEEAETDKQEELVEKPVNKDQPKAESEDETDEEVSEEYQTDITDDRLGEEWAKSLIDTIEEPCMVVWNDNWNYKQYLGYKDMEWKWREEEGRMKPYPSREGDVFAVIIPASEIKEGLTAIYGDVDTDSPNLDIEWEELMEGHIILLNLNFNDIISRMRVLVKVWIHDVPYGGYGFGPFVIQSPKMDAASWEKLKSTQEEREKSLEDAKGWLKSVAKEHEGISLAVWNDEEKKQIVVETGEVYQLEEGDRLALVVDGEIKVASDIIGVSSLWDEGIIEIDPSFHTEASYKIRGSIVFEHGRTYEYEVDQVVLKPLEGN